MCTAVDGCVEASPEQTPTDECRKEDDEDEERRQHEEVACERQRPEAEEREQRKEDNDVHADEAIDCRVREEPPLIEEVTDNERQDQIGK